MRDVRSTFACWGRLLATVDGGPVGTGRAGTKVFQGTRKRPYNNRLEGLPLLPLQLYFGVRMKERDWIEPIVERVVGRVLDNHVVQLRAEIVRQVGEEIAAAPAMASSPSHKGGSSSGPADLARAVTEIQIGSSQREILRALLEASSRYAARVALFVVKGSHATGWQGRGFGNDSAVKDFALDDKAPAVVRAISNRVVASVPVADQDARFLKEFGAPSGDGRLLPLMLKDKVAALVYADSGTDASGLLDASSLELLVLSTGAWLEGNLLPQQGQKDSMC